MRPSHLTLGVFPSPLWGGVGGGGGAMLSQVAPSSSHRTTPLPNPPPQGGREQTECGEGADRVPEGADRASGEGLGARVVVDCAQNVLEHAIDIRQHIVVPIAPHAIAVGFENSRAVAIGGRSLSVLATIDLDNDAPRVTGEINDVAANSNLATEMCAWRRNSVAQMPPKFPLCFRRRGPHLAGELTLPWHDCAIALRPDPRLVPYGHIVVPRLGPPPPTPPHSRLRACPLPANLKSDQTPAGRGLVGEGSTPNTRHASATLARAPTCHITPRTNSHNLLILRAHLLTSRQRRTKPEQDHAGKRRWRASARTW